MPKITVPKERITEKLDVDDEALEQALSDLGTDVESITDEEVEVELFPNRTDLLSSEILRKSLENILQTPQNINVSTGKSDYVVDVDEAVHGVRPFTACAVIENVSLSEAELDSIITLQEKMHVTFGRNRAACAIGLYPVTKNTFPITYTAKEPTKINFKPLGSSKKMTGDEILENHEKGKLFAHLLENEDMYPVFLNSEGSIMSMPPIINSAETGTVTTKTNTIFIECSGHRFEHVSKALNILSTHFSLLGADVKEVQVNYEEPRITPDFSREQFEISTEYIKKILGFDITDEEISTALQSMDYEVSAQKNKVFAHPPAYRTDVYHARDIIEDISIGHGFGQIPVNKSRTFQAGSLHTTTKTYRKILSLLIGAGFQEIYTYILCSTEKAKKLQENPIPLKNSVSEHYDGLRSTLLQPFLTTLQENTGKKYPQKYVEIAPVFKDNKSIEEPIHLACSISKATSSVTEMKQVIQTIANITNVELTLRSSKQHIFMKGRNAEIICKNKVVGRLGELHPRMLSEYGVTMPTTYLELHITKIFS